MTLIRWSPLSPQRELSSLRDEFDRVFENALTGRVARPEATVFVPSVDIEETSEEFVLRADLPGVPQKDVKVSLMGDTLTIRGERRLENDKRNGGMHRTERAYGTFERSFTLGASVRSDKVSAKYRDGVLEIHVPKAEEARVREIEVQVA